MLAGICVSQARTEHPQAHMATGKTRIALGHHPQGLRAVVAWMTNRGGSPGPILYLLVTPIAHRFVLDFLDEYAR